MHYLMLLIAALVTACSVQARERDCQILKSRLVSIASPNQLVNVRKDDRAAMATKQFSLLDTFSVTIGNPAGSNHLDIKYKRSNDVIGYVHETITTIYSYPKKLETLVNFQIRAELRAFYAYTNMAQWARRYDMDLPGFEKLFSESAAEELKHADAFMKYQAKRGGRVELMDIMEPEDPSWLTGREVLADALKLEKNVTDEVLCLHQLAADMQDTHFVDFLESEVIPEQYDSMKKLATQIKTLDRMSNPKSKNYGLAEFHFDQMLQQSKV